MSYWQTFRKLGLMVLLFAAMVAIYLYFNFRSTSSLISHIPANARSVFHLNLRLCASKLGESPAPQYDTLIRKLAVLRWLEKIQDPREPGINWFSALMGFEYGSRELGGKAFLIRVSRPENLEHFLRSRPEEYGQPIEIPNGKWCEIRHTKGWYLAYNKLVLLLMHDTLNASSDREKMMNEWIVPQKESAGRNFKNEIALQDHLLFWYHGEPCAGTENNIRPAWFRISMTDTSLDAQGKICPEKIMPIPEMAMVFDGKAPAFSGLQETDTAITRRAYQWHEQLKLQGGCTYRLGIQTKTPGQTEFSLSMKPQAAAKNPLDLFALLINKHLPLIF